MQMLLLRSIQELESLPLTSWNIRQPALHHDLPDALDSGTIPILLSNETVPNFPLPVHTSGGLHLIIVPGLAFTQSGHRLGSGRGYYDRYLEKLMTSSDGRPFLLALAFSQQILPHLPTDPFDVSVHQVITCD